jgi:hypothetical protein
VSRAGPLLRPELLALLLLAAAALGVWPVGAYPIDGDWACMWSLARLRETGEIRVFDWMPRPLWTHLAWGWLFTLPVGFSFTAAKLSTLATAALGMLALASGLRFAGASERTIVVAALALLFHPLFFFHAFLFEADVPAAAWSTWALVGYARGLAAAPRPAPGWLALGSLAACLGGGAQPSALLVVAAVGLHLVAFERRALRAPRTWLAAFALPAAALAVFGLGDGQGLGGSDASGGPLASLAGGWARTSGLEAAWLVYVIAAYTAGFTLPLVAALPLRAFRPGAGLRARAALAAAGVLGLLFAWGALGAEWLFPYLPDRWTRFGYWNPNEVLLGARPVLWSEEVAWALSVVLLLSLVAVLLLLSRAPAPEGGDTQARRSLRRLAGCLLVLQLAHALAAAPILLDRQLLTLAPTALVVVALATRELPRWLPFLLLWTPLAACSLAGTHDAHAMSRAAFAAGEALRAQGVDPALVDAGHAFAGWHMHVRSQQELRAGLPPRWRGGLGGSTSDPWYLRRVAPRVLSRYKVTLSEQMASEGWLHGVAPPARSIALLPSWSNHRVLRRLTWHSLWPWGERELFVLEDPSAVDPG